MKTKHDYQNEFEYQGVFFHIRYEWPAAIRHKAAPCRGCIDPLDPMTGKKLTKRQVYGKDSDCPVRYRVCGKDPQDIWDNHRETAAAYLISHMVRQGLIESKPAASNERDSSADLAELARDFKDEFFSKKRKWQPSTIQQYRGQYDLLVDELVGIDPQSLDLAAYQQLQIRICRHALQQARPSTEDIDPDSWQYGDEAPSSARKRMSILCTLIEELKEIEDIPIPVIPTPYNGQASPKALLLECTDKGRSLPLALLRNACAESVLDIQAAIMADAGLRIGEVTGLLFGSLRSLETSQGTQYYLVIDGQAQHNGVRTEKPKTPAAYRSVPLSTELGAALMRRRRELEEKYGDLSLRLMCGQADPDGFAADPARVRAWRAKTEAEVSALLRQPAFFQAICAARVYLFDQAAQDEKLLSMLTCHALRRNFCTGLYCDAQLDTPEIYRQMGHEYKQQPYRAATGLTPAELRLMCLRKHVSASLYHPANPLRYSVDGAPQATEVPACEIQLTIPPGACIELTVEDTEPNTITRIQDDELSIQYLRRDERRDVHYTYALLAAQEQSDREEDQSDIVNENEDAENEL